MSNEELTPITSQMVSRRNLIKGVVAAGAVAGTGGLLAACGSDDGAESTEDTTASDAAATDTSKGTIKIGFVTPQTGPLAPFGEADAFVIGELRNLVASGYEGYTIEILDRDSESNSNTAATAEIGRAHV